MAVRVIRLLEYVYPDLEEAHEDMSRWYVQGTRRPIPAQSNRTITSTVILNPTDFEVVQIKEESE